MITGNVIKMRKKKRRKKKKCIARYSSEREKILRKVNYRLRNDVDRDLPVCNNDSV